MKNPKAASERRIRRLKQPGQNQIVRRNHPKGCFFGNEFTKISLMNRTKMYFAGKVDFNLQIVFFIHPGQKHSLGTNLFRKLSDSRGLHLQPKDNRCIGFPVSAMLNGYKEKKPEYISWLHGDLQALQDIFPAFNMLPPSESAFLKIENPAFCTCILQIRGILRKKTCIAHRRWSFE